MLTHMSIELIRWTKHQNLITIGLAMPKKKVATCYSILVKDVCLRHWFPITNEDTPVESPKS
jgi:hypothetical protein